MHGEAAGFLAIATAVVCVRCATMATPSALDRSAVDAEADDEAATTMPTRGDGGRGADASPAATGSTDAPAPCAALPLCDGFESAAVGGPPSATSWTIARPDCSGAGTLAVDDSQAHGGKHSVRIDGGGGYCDHVFLANYAVMPSLGASVYARLFVRLSAPLGSGHVTFLAMKDAADKNGDVRMGGQDSILVFNRQSDDATLPVLSPAGVGESVAVPADAWTCLEFHVDETAGTIETWVDGAAVAGLTENGTAAADVSTQWLARAPWKPSLTDFRLGWESYSGQAMTLWFDDVALDSQRIGCASR